MCMDRTADILGLDVVSGFTSGVPGKRPKTPETTTIAIEISLRYHVLFTHQIPTHCVKNALSELDWPGD
jgi:hypothetical protein